MIVIGLTGSIAMGKSTTAGLFAERGIPVYDADKAVHDLYTGAAVPLIDEAFPGCVKDGVVDRAALRDVIQNDPAALKILEQIVHPLVREAETKFRFDAESSGEKIILLDIPLLFETNGDERVDVCVVVTASPEIQRARVMERGTMSDEQFAKILSRQMPDEEKRRRAHALIDTSFGIEHAQRSVDALLSSVSTMRG